MILLSWYRSVATRLFHRSRIDDEMEEELRSHIQHRADDLEASGLDRAQAERRARIEFGGQTRFKEECYDALGGTFVESLIQDVRLTLRGLRKSPGFALVAVLTLALAIGANAVVFAVANTLVLRPLNVPRAQSLYGIERGKEKSPQQSYPDYLDLRDRNRSFEDLAGFSIAAAGLDTGKEPSRVMGYVVSGNYFDALGVQPYLGRFFHGSDEHGPNSAPYLVLAHAYWHSHFQDDRGVVGRVVRLNQRPFTVLGVAPPEFQGTLLFFSPSFWVPMVNNQQLDGASILDARGIRAVMMVIGHLKAGVTPPQAIADLNSVGSYLEKTFPKEDGKMTFTLARPGLFGDSVGGAVRGFMAGLLLLAGLILLGACANLGSLFAARAADRSREVALRLALGSSRNRILRGLFTEAVLISLAGGALGLLGSLALLSELSAWRPIPQTPSLHVPVSPDVTVYLLALALALASGFLFGIVPVRQVLRTDPYQIVKSGPGSGIGRRLSLRDLLLVVQVAICAVLVTASLVAVRGLVRSLDAHVGFEPRNAMVASTILSMGGTSGDGVPEVERRMIDALQTIPGVRSVGLVDFRPLSTSFYAASVFSGNATDLSPSSAAASAFAYRISPGYFHAAGTALLSGRTVSWHDDKGAPRVAVVNREFARKLFGSVAGAVGGYFKMDDGTRLEVVGVVEDGKYLTLAEDPRPAMFLPFPQSPSSWATLVVRSGRDPRQLAAAMRSKLRDVNAGLPFDIQPWTSEMESALFTPRVATVSLGVLGSMGALLAITGIFGMAAYSVSRRMREFGIRLALGAGWREVLQAALGRALKLLACGSAAGLVLGVLASRVLAVIVYQATPRDPLVLAGVALAMLSLGLLATWIPAQRALAADPSALLREG